MKESILKELNIEEARGRSPTWQTDQIKNTLERSQKQRTFQDTERYDRLKKRVTIFSDKAMTKEKEFHLLQ